MSDEEDDAGSGLLADERWLWVQVGKCFPKPAHLIAHTQPGNLFGAVSGSFLLSVLMIRTTASGWRGAVPRSYAWQGYRCADTGRCRLGTDSCQLPYLPGLLAPSKHRQLLSQLHAVACICCAAVRRSSSSSNGNYFLAMHWHPSAVSGAIRF